MKSFEDFNLGLGPGALVLLDSNPLIYRVEGGTAARAGVLDLFLEAAGRGRIGLVASTLVWTEVLTRPQALEDKAVADSYRRILADSSRLVLAALDVAIAEETARLLGRGLGRLGLADAVHLATARIRGVAAILTNDSAWRDRALDKDPGLPRILLVDELAWSLS